jgi:siroheme synthase
VFNATRPNETALTATLATLPQRIAEASSDAPCIVLIGDAVARCVRTERVAEDRVQVTGSGS